MASGAEILDAAQALADARASLALAESAFQAAEDLVQDEIAEELTARNAAQLAFAIAQDAARANTPSWLPSLTALQAAQASEQAAVAALAALSFDGT